MTIWLAVRHVRLLLGVVVGLALAAIVTGNFAVPVPISLEPVAVPVALMLPLALSTAAAYSLGAGDELLEAVSARPLGVMDSCLIGGLTAVAIALLLAIDQIGVNPLGTAAARNTAGFIGLMYFGRLIVGGFAASLTPVAYMMVAIAFGTTAAGQVRWWAWPLAPGNDSESWLIALAFLMGGITVGALVRARIGSAWPA
ncbi:MAG TPA: hypothetical protein VJ820_08720 [Propionibacteriaceae bacterium]|nr:hypothetical protein [Propionibacteriaceae bacterium]